MRKAISAVLGLAGLTVTLTACDNPGTGRTPVVNSGSYDWRDSFLQPNGYPLPGYEGYFKIPQ
jgi:hypothetical protein